MCLFPVVGIAEYDVVIVFGQPRLGSADDFGKKGVLDVRDDESDDPSFVRLQGSRNLVGNVVIPLRYL